ncbi:hypothetical protein GCM10022421_32950 [Oceanisphaera sediminis]|uniref:Uncharacterized protein n=1 Tax=Oceanisphaera sediminis TaxID=981381 RepID=A0ABP7ERC1_9GAMM
MTYINEMGDIIRGTINQLDGIYSSRDKPQEKYRNSNNIVLSMIQIIANKTNNLGYDMGLPELSEGSSLRELLSAGFELSELILKAAAISGDHYGDLLKLLNNRTRKSEITTMGKRLTENLGVADLSKNWHTLQAIEFEQPLNPFRGIKK